MSGGTIRAFRDRFSKVPLIVASLTDQHARRLEFREQSMFFSNWHAAIKRYQSLR